MNDHILFRGIMPALITPLNDNGTIREKSVRPLMDWQSAQGVQGFYVLGATGEGAVLAEKERMRMAEAAADAVKGTGKKLILHIGAPELASAERLAKHAREVGADAVSSVYPNFFCHYSVEEALDYYRRLIDACGLPMLGYCQALMQGADVVSFVDRFMQLDGTIGVKYTFPNYYNMYLIKQLCSGNINVINGPDETLLAGLSMGADGGIGSTYNLMADWYVQLYSAFCANDVSAASALQQKINRVIGVCIRYGVVPSIKLCLNEMGFDVGHAAAPGRRYTEEQRKEIITAFREAGLFDK